MSVPGPLLGPCSSWINGSDVAGCCAPAKGEDAPPVFEQVAFEASMALFEISGRQWAGLCGPRTVRPCHDPSSCSCWNFLPGGSRYVGDCGEHCGCGRVSRVRLAGYPVREVVSVRIDGELVDPLSYRLDEYEWLVRKDDPGPPARTRAWPACQNMALDDTEPGTFSVAYLWGGDPPDLGRRAAVEVACELYKSCTPSTGACKVPPGTTKVSRQGVEIERKRVIDWLNPEKPTGLPAVDLFLKGYWGDRGRRPVVWSPDVQPYAQEVGI